LLLLYQSDGVWQFYFHFLLATHFTLLPLAGFLKHFNLSYFFIKVMLSGNFTFFPPCDTFYAFATNRFLEAILIFVTHYHSAVILLSFPCVTFFDFAIFL
jgi:hypothetical protein